MTVAQIGANDTFANHAPPAHPAAPGPRPLPASGRPTPPPGSQRDRNPDADRGVEPSVDRRLLRRIAARDEAAFADLFDRHAGLLLGLLTRMLGTTAEAEEVLQEVFLHVWRRVETYAPERASPRGWLIVVARSRALDRLRARGARRQREEAAHAERRRLASDSPPAHARLEEEERHLHLRRALERVPGPQRRAVELAFFEGLTHREVAARLAIPLGTAKSRILHGLRKLRALLEVHGPLDLRGQDALACHPSFETH